MIALFFCVEACTNTIINGLIREGQRKLTKFAGSAVNGSCSGIVGDVSVGAEMEV